VILQQEKIEALLYLVPDAPKRLQFLPFRSVSRIVKSPVDRFGAREYRTLLPGTITHRDDVIEFLVDINRYVIRFVARYVDSNFFHSIDAARVQSLRVRSSAEDFKSVSRHTSKQAFSHLASSGIAGTEEKNTLLICHKTTTRQASPPGLRLIERQ